MNETYVERKGTKTPKSKRESDKAEFVWGSAPVRQDRQYTISQDASKIPAGS